MVSTLHTITFATEHETALATLSLSLLQHRTMSLPDPTTATLLYKVLTPQEFTSLPLPPTLWQGTSFDLTASPPGIHLTTSLTLPTTLATFFPHDTDLWILAIPRTPRIDSGLVWDGTSPSCARLNGVGIDCWSEEVAVRRPIKRGEDGQWDLGELAW